MAGRIMEKIMASIRMHRPTTEEIRSTFFAMMDRLEGDAQKISDELVRKAKLVHLQIFRAHSDDIGEPQELSDFCLSVLGTMKCSIDAALFRRQGRSIEKVLKGMRARDRVDLSSIVFQGVQRLGLQSPVIDT
jgi:hypothetical protein